MIATQQDKHQQGQRVIVGRYRLTAAIGSGGVGTVWQAWDNLLDREVAVKEIMQFGAGGPDAPDETYQRTLSEARAAARISHPGVAAVYDVVSEAGRPYIVMELIDGRSLAQVIDEEGPLASPRVAEIGRQVLAALTAGHSAGVLHRDLKPANVLITAACRAVLTDFGIASITGHPSTTQTGVVLGTPSYLAPERAQGRIATPAADMWSLGAMLFAAASGRGPFDGYDGNLATLSAIITQEPPRLPGDGPLSGIIHALMSRDPQQRPTAAETAKVLAAAARAEPVTARVTAPVTEAITEQLLPVAPSAKAPWSPTVTSDVPAMPGLVSGATFAQATAARRRRSRRRAVLTAGATLVTSVAVLAAALVVLSSPVHHDTAHLAAAQSGTTHSGTANSGTANSASELAAATSSVPALQQEFRVADALNANGSPQLFARARDGALATDRLVNGSWSGWTDLPGGRIFTGVPAVARSNDGRLVVVARTVSGKLAYLWQSGSGSWNGPIALGAWLTSSDPAVIAGPGGHLEVFARLASHGIGTITQLGTTVTSGWSGWTSLGGSLASAPAAAMNSSGDPEVFAIGAGGSLMNDYFQDGSWQAWEALPGGRVFTGMPSVGTNFDGRLEVFARTTSGTIEHVWQQPQDREDWGGPLVLISGIASNPATYSTVGGRLETFTMTADGTVMHTWQIEVKDGTGWDTPASIGGYSTGVPVPVRAGDQSDVFIRMPDGTIAWNRQSPSLTWSGWSDLGGSF